MHEPNKNMLIFKQNVALQKNFEMPPCFTKTSAVF